MLASYLLVIATVCITRAIVIFGRILKEVDSKRGANEQVSFLFVNLRFGQVLAEHQQLFPGDDKRRQMKISACIGFALLAVLFIRLAVG